MRASRLFACLAGLALASPLAAQISWQPNFNMVANINNAVVLNPCADDGCKGDKAQPRRGQPDAARPRPNPLAAQAQLTFVASPVLRKLNLAAFVDGMRPGDSAGAAQMAKMFASTDMIEPLGNAIAPTGLKTNNVADAFTLWWTTALNASRGRSDSSSRAQIQSVRAQVVKTMLGDQRIARATAAQKQEFAEDLFVKSRLLNTAVTEAQGNPDDLASLARTARKTALATGLDLDTMELTADGFVSVD